MYQGLRCAIALADHLGEGQPDWELAADQLGHAVACHEYAFADKSRFAMDWYYPVLGGPLRGAAGSERLTGGWDTFVVPGLGVRCVSDQPWVTGAETCELAIALDVIGDQAQALDLLEQIQHLRDPGGGLLDRLAVRQPGPLPQRAEQLDGGRGRPGRRRAVRRDRRRGHLRRRDRGQDQRRARGERRRPAARPATAAQPIPSAGPLKHS